MQKQLLNGAAQGDDQTADDIAVLEEPTRTGGDQTTRPSFDDEDSDALRLVGAC